MNITEHCSLNMSDNVGLFLKMPASRGSSIPSKPGYHNAGICSTQVPMVKDCVEENSFWLVIAISLRLQIFKAEILFS